MASSTPNLGSSGSTLQPYETIKQLETQLVINLASLKADPHPKNKYLFLKDEVSQRVAAKPFIPWNFPIIPPYISQSLLDHYENQERYDQAYKQLIGMNCHQLIRVANVHNIQIANQPVVPHIPNQNLPPSRIEIWRSGLPSQLILSNAPDFQNGVADAEIDACFRSTVRVDDFFRSEFGKYPVNNPQKLMRVYTKSINIPLNSAFWNSSDECVYIGDVDTRFFNPFSTNLDLLTHEFAHAITQYNSPLWYRLQSGALNESLSDVYAMILKHKLARWNANGEDASWYFGEGLLKNAGRGAIRSFTAQPAYENWAGPWGARDPQVKHMRDFKYVEAFPLLGSYSPEGAPDHTNDYGEVHINSGIPNHAFYLAAIGIQGPIWGEQGKIGKIWHNAHFLNSYPRKDFQTFARETITAAKALGYGEGVVDKVRKAWRDVGVDFDPSSTINAPDNPVIKLLGGVIAPLIWVTSNAYNRQQTAQNEWIKSKTSSKY